MSVIKYRPSLDGLRAVAVISIFIYHLDRSLLPGGFVGVDIFFVLSGYLITSIIEEELNNNLFSFTKFYQRRIARIFPLFYLVTIFTLIAANYLYSSQDFSSTGAVARVASISLVNIRYMLLGGYFEISPDAQPLMHYWSLSIEEQFYLLFPLFLFILYRYVHSQKKIIIIILLLLITSFSLCVYLSNLKPTWAFYLLPTRAWELLTGCALAIYIKNKDRKINYGDMLLGLIGLTMIFISLFIINDNQKFPGYIAALPVLGTALLINANSSKLLSERLLGFQCLTYIGKISYSLYLWHWPIFSFTDYTLYEATSYIRLSIKIILTLVISVLSYHYFETPLRKYINQSKAMLLSYIMFFFVATTLFISGDYIKNNYYISSDAYPIKDGGFIINKEIKKCSLVLIGDSNASMYATSIKGVANAVNVRANILSVSGGDALPYSKLWEESVFLIKKERPDYVILANLWSYKLKNDHNKLNIAITEIKKYSKFIFIIAQPPMLPEVATRQGIRDNGNISIFEKSEMTEIRKNVNSYIETMKSNNVIVINPDKLFTNLNGEIIFKNKDGKQLYQDNDHLSNFGSDLVVQTLLLPELKRNGLITN